MTVAAPPYRRPATGRRRPATPEAILQPKQVIAATKRTLHPAARCFGVRRPGWIVLLAAAATLALAYAATAAQPTAEFTVTPSTPTEGLAASYDAVLSPAYRRATVEWDFDGDPGDVFETQGASVAHVYTTPGEKQMSMRVVKEGEVKAVVTKTIYVNARPDESAVEPDTDPTPTPVPPSPTPTEPGARDPDVVDGATSVMMPFPIVRIAGQLLPWGARVRLLAVTAPPGAVVTARCRGQGCPLRWLRRRSRAKPVRIRGLERRLVAGIRLEILVRQHGFVGKYTRFRIRTGVRPPLRDDRCLLPGRRTPVRCSFG